MPGKVGAGTFWTQTVAWANNGGTDTDAVLKAIDDSWPASKRSDGLRGASPTVARPTIISARGGGWPSARTEQPGLSRFVLPIAGLIGSRPVRRRHPRSARPARRAEPLASIYEALGNRSGATDLRNGSGDQMIAKLLLAVIALGGRRRRHLAAVPRRRRAGQPAAAEMARPDPAVGLRGPRPRAAGGLPGLPRGGNDPAQLPGRPGQFTLANYAVMTEPEFTQILRNNVIWLLVGTVAAWCSALSSPRSSIASDARRWPRPSCSCRWPSRSSAHRSSGASSTPGSRPASRRSGC